MAGRSLLRPAGAYGTARYRYDRHLSLVWCNGCLVIAIVVMRKRERFGLQSEESQSCVVWTGVAAEQPMYDIRGDLSPSSCLSCLSCRVPSIEICVVSNIDMSPSLRDLVRRHSRIAKALVDDALVLLICTHPSDFADC